MNNSFNFLEMVTNSKRVKSLKELHVKGDRGSEGSGGALAVARRATKGGGRALSWAGRASVGNLRIHPPFPPHLCEMHLLEPPSPNTSLFLVGPLAGRFTVVD